MMKTQSGSLKSYLRKQYGQETQKIVDVFGKELQRVARFANHHHFNIRCLKTVHCPPSLKLKSPVNTDRARQAADRVSRIYMQERVKTSWKAERKASPTVSTILTYGVIL